MKVNRRGLFGTIFMHGLVLALLILGGLTFPDPPPEEEGILVNFGTDDTGFGFIEPKGDESNAGNPEPQVAQAIPESVEESIPDDPAPSDPVYEEAAVEDNSVEEAVIEDNTQDVEETPIKEDPKPTAEEIRKEQEKIRKQQEEADRIKKEKEDERIRNVEEDRLRKVEEERIKKEQEAERLRVAEAARIAQEKQETANRLNNMGKNTFGNPGVGTEEGSEGINPGAGNNQGVLTGQADAPNYGEGRGLGDGGDSFGLTGRNAVNKGTPDVDKCEVTSRIIVTVEIQVDRQGNVILASVLTSTFSEKCIYEAVVAAARKTKFNSDTNASFKQKGWIRYTIEP
jgi:colicin import membrane protein